MNLQLKTNCFQLSIDAPGACDSSDPKEPVITDEKYTPENSANPYDEAGLVHNQVIKTLRKLRSEKKLSNEDIMIEATKMVSSYKFKSKALQGLGETNTDIIQTTFKKYGIIDGCIPFPWPWLPGGPIYGFPFPSSGNHYRTIDPVDLIFILIDALRQGRIPIFAKNQIIEWENNVMDSDLSKDEKAACLMNASIARYSMALAVEETNQSDMTQYRVSPWWSFVADGVGGLVGSLGGGIGTIVGASAASGVADAVIEHANEG